MIVTKAGVSDTSGFVLFTDISSTIIRNFGTPLITFVTSGYTVVNVSLFGIYTINLTYNY